MKKHVHEILIFPYKSNFLHGNVNQSNVKIKYLRFEKKTTTANLTIFPKSGFNTIVSEIYETNLRS